MTLVPAGTAITEEHYWVLYSVYNEQITRAEQHLDSTVSAIRSEMNAQKQQVTERMEQAEENVDQRASAAEELADTRATEAENLSNQNRAAIETRMANIEARQEANVRASTDADADYAAEVVDARVSEDSRTHASLGTHLREIETDIDQVKQNLDWYPSFEFGAINIVNGVESSTHYRVKSGFIRTGLISHVAVNECYAVIICFYNQEKTFVTAAGWYYHGTDIEVDKTHPYCKLLVRHQEDLEESIEFLDTENVWCYVYDAASNLKAYAREKASDATDNRIRNLFNKIIRRTVYDVSDADDRALSNTARWFIPTLLPEKSYVDYVTIMLYRLSSTGVVEVWERS